VGIVVAVKLPHDVEMVEDDEVDHLAVDLAPTRGEWPPIERESGPGGR